MMTINDDGDDGDGDDDDGGDDGVGDGDGDETWTITERVRLGPLLLLPQRPPHTMDIELQTSGQVLHLRARESPFATIGFEPSAKPCNRMSPALP